MAPILRHADGRWRGLFIGVERKSSVHGQTGAIDPFRTWASAPQLCCINIQFRRAGGRACDSFALRHIERQGRTQTNRAARSWGKPSWSSVHPKSNDRDRALKRFIGCAPRRERKPLRGELSPKPTSLGVWSQGRGPQGGATFPQAIKILADLDQQPPSCDVR
jgi:hypothetical protein